MAKILMAEDDPNLGPVLKEWLEDAWHTVELVTTGSDAGDRLRMEQYDVIILDWGLPGVTGLELCRSLRAANNPVPVIMLTGKKELTDKVSALDCGADDYLTKPFEMPELEARIRALLRRPPQTVSNVLRAKDLELDIGQGVLRKGGKDIHLMPREFALLEFFMRHPHQLFSTETLMSRVWSTDTEAGPETVRFHITKLRAKIDTPDAESLIKTVHRQGYRFEP